MQWSISEMVNAKDFKIFATVFSTPENLLVGIPEALGTQKSHFLGKNVFWKKYCGVSQKLIARAFQIFAIVFSTTQNLLVGITEALGTQKATF